MKIKKGDKVQITVGKDKGRQGEVARALPKNDRLIITGLNIFKKHIRSQQGTKGGILERERPLLASKVALICPNCKKLTRVGYQIDKSGIKMRVCKKCHQIIDKKINQK